MSFNVCFRRLFLLLALLAGGQASAQQLTVGARGGAARTFHTGPDADPNGQYRWAGAAGIFLDIGLGENWHLQNDFQWARKGYRNDTSRLRLDYAVWSPTLSYLFSGFAGEVMRGRLLGGLYGGRLLDWQRSNADYNEIFREWDYGIVWGGGLTFDLYQRHFHHYIHIDLRGYIGTRSVYTQGAQVRNVVWQLTIGYAIP